MSKTVHRDGHLVVPLGITRKRGSTTSARSGDNIGRRHASHVHRDRRDKDHDDGFVQQLC